MNYLIKIILGVISLFVFSCVSPPDYSDGLLENIPAIVNDNDYFSFSLFADDYTENKEWDLTMPLTESDVLLSTLIIKDLNISASDSSFLYMINTTGDTVLAIGIMNEVVWNSIDSVTVIGVPQKILFIGDNLSGRVEYQIIKS